MVRNWQTRYFVLNVGRIYYYQEQTDCFPYGEILKVGNCKDMNLEVFTVSRVK